MKTTSIFFLFIAVVMAGCTKIDNENGGGNNWKPNLGDYDPVPLSDFDNDFYKWCVREFDATGDGILQYGEIKKIEKIRLDNRESEALKSLNGIKYFTSLKYLGGYDGALCKLTSLDVSYNTLLDTLKLGHQYDLKHLTVGKHPNLKYIGFSDSKIQSLDLSDCSSLQDISVNCCTLNVSGCKALKSIHITGDKLDPQSRDSVLETLLGLNTCSSLESLRATYTTKLTSLDISGLKKLKILYLNGNELTSLHIKECTALEKIDCSSNNLKTLDLDASTRMALKSLNVSYNKLTSLDVNGFENLQLLNCNDNELTSLNASGLKNIKNLECHENKLTSLDISGCENLQSLYCYDNELTSLNASGLKTLMFLHCYNNKLTSLNVSGCSALEKLYISSGYPSGSYENELQTLDVSTNTKLKSFLATNTPLSTLYVWKGWRKPDNWEYNDNVQIIEK